MRYAYKSAFTIVELAVVIVVIGILASIVLVAYPGIQKRSADTQVQGDLRQAAMKLDAYKANNGGYPLTQELVDNGKGLPKSTTDLTYDYTATVGTYCLSAVSQKSGKIFKISSGGSEISEGECPEPEPTIPSAPANVVVQKISGAYNVSWNSVSGATSYTVQYSTSNTFTPLKGTQSGITETNVWLCAPTIVQYDYVRVAALGIWGQTDWSSPVQVTVGGPFAPC